MKTRQAQRSQAGYALLLVTVFIGLSLFALSGMLDWSSTSASLVQRNILYYDTLAVAQGAVDKVLTKMAGDFQAQGQAMTQNSVSTYSQIDPRPSSDSIWSNYLFTDGQGNVNQTFVQQLTNWGYTALQTKYTGLNGNAATYRITASVRALNATFNIASALQQDIQVASIPLFGFAVFYALDLEICPGTALSIGGRAHSNGNVYLNPSSPLTFNSHVTSAQSIVLGASPNDPTRRTPGPVVFQGEHDGMVNSLNLPLGTNNTPAGLRAIVEVPPASESASSPLGLQRYYNKADLIILVSNATVTAMSGLYNGFSVAVPWSETQKFVKTNALFYDLRENMYMQTTEIDINKLRSEYNHLTSVLGRAVQSLYVADLRTQTYYTEPAVRLINGQTLPPYGLTVATPDPLYVQGHYNAPSAYLGTANTTTTLPASLVADAITVLSGNWNDNRSWWPLSYRTASSTTVNAAIIAGIVPSDGDYYSGGMENVIRLLENWSGKTLTFNGSVVVLFPSRIAIAPWGASSGVYNTPTRNWSFDPNFLNAAKLPAGTPKVRTVIRSQWAMVQGS
ncbi:MAG: hypothetical protein ACYDH9_13540 [Limisphaerales bacterium]